MYFSLISNKFMAILINAFLLFFIYGIECLNYAPSFLLNMNQHTVMENTPVGTAVYTLTGNDPEGSKITFGIEETSLFKVDPITGIVTVAGPIDRELSDEARLIVTLTDEVGEGEGQPNIVRVPISVIILDENDNSPVFRGVPYRQYINENTPVGRTIFQAIDVHDPDLVGNILNVECDRSGAVYKPELCDYIQIVPRIGETDQGMFRGSLILKKALDFQKMQSLILTLVVYDGLHAVNADIFFTIVDVQNMPPVFIGSTAGVVDEDAPIGTDVLTISAIDGDSGNPREIFYEIVENPGNYFSINSHSGKIQVDQVMDRESINTSSGVLIVKIRASEIIGGFPSDDVLTSTIADVLITIRDINDEAPVFSRNGYSVSIPENIPFGTPLASLNIQVKDSDTGMNSFFELELVDKSGNFLIEPQFVQGFSTVNVKINSKSLDFEDPNQRKFFLLVIATETHTKEKLSSTVTVEVQLKDVNDNSPVFEKESFTAIVSETADKGTEVITIKAHDFDDKEFGTQGIRFTLDKAGNEFFSINSISGQVFVRSCESPGRGNCLDYERQKTYFIAISATDNNGDGRTTLANLRISLSDKNDNSPEFVSPSYYGIIDEGKVQFEPRMFVSAIDADETSILRYKILDGNTNDLFFLHPVTGEVRARHENGLRLDNIPTDTIILNIAVSDKVYNDTSVVKIQVKDVNDRFPTFEKTEYSSVISEDAALGVLVEKVIATDADFGSNAKITFRIHKGAHNDFEIDPDSGSIYLSGKLDYDRKSNYNIELVAVDHGVPSLSGTTTLKVKVMNKNNKTPYFLPTTQRCQITENVDVGSRIFQLNATDPDIEENINLSYSIVEPITAVDNDGRQVFFDTRFKDFFSVDSVTGEVFVASPLDRSLAAIVTLTVQITDNNAVPPQHGLGSLVITIVDINDFEPVFQKPWSPDNPYISLNVDEEQPIGSLIYTFVAHDIDSNIDYYEIVPKNKYFMVERGSGKLHLSNRLDYEAFNTSYKSITFNVLVYDAGIPQKSSSAVVSVNIVNINDETPRFQPLSYNASVIENSPTGTELISVMAIDDDEGDFGHVTYRLTGLYKDAFSIGSEDGSIRVLDSRVLDRERTQFILIHVIATDSAQPEFKKSSSALVNVTISDQNDNPPEFMQKVYTATIINNIPYYPNPSPIVQVTAVDADAAGLNSELVYSITSGNELQLFFIDEKSGIVYPNSSFVGQENIHFDLLVQVNDMAGKSVWPIPSTTHVLIEVEKVNSHQPRWFPEPPKDETIEIEEESDISDVVILKVKAKDGDGSGENGRISYFLKQNNLNVVETKEFSMDTVSGELRAKISFDREAKSKYEIVLVAQDHGKPVSFETLRFVTVILKDINDNEPQFNVVLGGNGVVRFTVPEEKPSGFFVGRVEAYDLDEEDFGKVYYYIVKGNEDNWFSIDKSYGNIYTKKVLDREVRDEYNIYIKTSNNAVDDFDCDTCQILNFDQNDASIVKVQIIIEDINDNFPRFEQNVFNVGIPFNVKVGDLILNAKATDPDLDAKNDLKYSIRTSNLFKAGSSVSAGSLVPSPFSMLGNGRLVINSLMTEFNQDHFVIDIETKDPESHHRAKAKVNLWIYEPDQLIKLVIDQHPKDVNAKLNHIVDELTNVTGGHVVVVADIRYHVDSENGLRRDMTDMFIHMVNSGNEIVSPDKVLQIVDANYDQLSLYYEDAGIKSIVQAKAIQVSSLIDQNMAFLIALILLLFFGTLMFSMVCCCMKSWMINVIQDKLPKQLSSKTPTVIARNGGRNESPTGTENPLWIDQKYKMYEEQELTMTVFTDQENSVNSTAMQHSRQGSVDAQSNAYATISKMHNAPANRRSLFNSVLSGLEASSNAEVGFTNFTHEDREYATLEKSMRSPPGPVVPGVHSTPLQQQDNSIQNRRSRLGVSVNGADNISSFPGRKSNLIINQNGEPELIAELQ